MAFLYRGQGCLIFPLECENSQFVTIAEIIEGKHRPRGGGGSSIVKVPGDVPPARVYFFGLLV